MVGRLSLLDRFLTPWIFLAMGVGIGIGYFFPSYLLLPDVACDLLRRTPDGGILQGGTMRLQYPPNVKIMLVPCTLLPLSG